MSDQNESSTSRSLTHRSASGVVWVGSAKAALTVMQLVLLVTLARLLLPEDFGIVGAALVVTGLVRPIARFGLGAAIVQREHLQTSQERAVLTALIALSTVTAAVLWSLAPTIAGWYQIPETADVLRALSLLFPVSAVGLLARSLLERNLEFPTLARVDVLSYLIYAITATTGAALGWGPWALVAAVASQTVFSTVALASRVRIGLGMPEWGELQDLLGFGLGLTIGRSADRIAEQGDNAVVGASLGSEELGVYGRAYQIMVIPATMLGQVLDSVLFPAMARRQTDPGALKRAYRRGAAAIALFVGPLSVVLAALSPELVLVVLGPQWPDAVDPLQILAAGMFFRGAYKMSESLARAKGAVYRRAWRRWIHAGLIVGGALVGRHWGLAGVAAGVLVALAVNYFLMAQLSLRILSMTWRELLDIHLPAIRITAVAGVTVLVARAAARSLEWPAFAVLGSTIAVVVAVLVLVSRRFPDYFLGPDGRWGLALVKDMVGLDSIGARFRRR